MINWLMDNAGTIIVSVILIIVIALAIRSIIRNKRFGRNCCDGNCSNCNKNCR